MRSLGRKSTPEQQRYNLIWLLPHLWVLNGRFISHSERLDADAMVDPSLRAMVAKDYQHLLEPYSGFLHSSGNYKAPDPKDEVFYPGALCSHFLSVLSSQPVTGQARDLYRLNYLAEFHEREAIRHNASIENQVPLADTLVTEYQSPVGQGSHQVPCSALLQAKTGDHFIRIPLLSLDHILRLPPRLRLDLSVLLAATVHGPVPTNVLDETLCILCLNKLPMERAQDLGQLPPYAVSVIALHVCELARQMKRRDLEHYDGFDADLLDSLNAVTYGVNCFDSDGIKDRHRRRLELIAHHAFSLLSRATSCPQISLRPASVAAQRHYDAILPLLQRAGYSPADLDLPAHGGHHASSKIVKYVAKSTILSLVGLQSVRW